VLNIIRDSITEPLEFLFDNISSRESTGTTCSNSHTSAHTIYDIIQDAVSKGLNTPTGFSSTWNSEINAKVAKLEEVTEAFYR
jgi:hypothetical protein